MKTISAILSCLFGLALWPTVTAAPLMYVPTGETNEVVVIDLHSDRIIERIAGLENAHGLAGNARSLYLIAGSMKPPGDRQDGVSEADHAAHHSGVARRENRAVSHVTLIDRRNHRLARRIPVPGLTHHTAISPDGRYAVAVHPGTGGISAIDLDTQTVAANVVSGAGPNFAVFSKDGDRLYVSNTRDGTIAVISTRNWKLLGAIDVGGEPEHMVLSPDGKRLYVVNVADGQLLEVDLPGASVRNIHAVGSAPHAVAVSPNRRWIYVTVKGENKVIRIDEFNGARHSTELQPAPYHLEYAGVVDKLYVSSRKLPRIWVLDPRTLAVRDIIDLGSGTAHQMVIIDE